MLRLYSYNAKWNLKLSLFSGKGVLFILVNVDYFFGVGTQIGKHPYFMTSMDRNQFPYQIWTHTNAMEGFQREFLEKKNVLSNTGPKFWTAHYGNQNRKTMSWMSQNNLFIDHCHNFESAWIPIIALWQNWSMLWPRSIISVALISIVSVDQQHCWALVAARAGLENWSELISIDRHWTALISTDQQWS